MFEFSCEFYLLVDLENKWFKYNTEVESFTSENRELYDIIDFSADFYPEDTEKLRDLPNGEYWVWVRGTAEFESDRDWESGIEEGHFILTAEKVKVEEFERPERGGLANDL